MDRLVRDQRNGDELRSLDYKWALPVPNIVTERLSEFGI